MNRTHDVRRYFSDCYCVIYSAAGGVYPSWAGASLLDQSADLSICSRWVWLSCFVWDVASSCDSCSVHYIDA